MKGYFITVEGIEGVGKSTNIALVKRILEEAGHSVILTREPGGTPRAEAIRGLVLSNDYGTIPEEAELLLMFAARAEHLANLIRPGLEAGQTVICDRFTDATFAYQGAGRGIPDHRIQELADWIHGDLWPDLTLLLDAPPETGLDRARNRGEKDRIEREKIEFFREVRGRYLHRAEADPQRFRIIDASLSIPEVERQILHAIQPLTEGVSP